MRTRIMMKILPRVLRDRVRPLIDEVHVEEISQTYRQVIQWANRNRHARLMFIPNHLKYITKVLRETSNPVGLHVHQTDDGERLPDSYIPQHWVIREAWLRLKSAGAQTSHFVSGHWSYNYQTFLACLGLGITNVHVRCIHIPRILECGFPSGITIIPVHRHYHDYDLIGETR